MTIYLKNKSNYKTCGITDILIFENNGKFVLSIILEHTSNTPLEEFVVNIPIETVERIDPV